MSQTTPRVTCAPWNPVRVKNVLPNRFVRGVRWAVDGEFPELKELESQEGSAQECGAKYPYPKVPYVTPSYVGVGHHHHKAAHKQDKGAYCGGGYVENIGRVGPLTLWP